MKKRFIILGLLLTFVELFFGIQYYQNGASYPGLQSYKSGNIKQWQTDFRQILLKALSIDLAWFAQKRSPPSFKIRNPEMTYQYLLDHPDIFDSKRAEPFIKKFYPPKISFESEYLTLTSPDQNTKIKVYELEITSFDQTSVSALIFLPPQSLLSGSLLFIHGHGTNYKKAAFDLTSSEHGFGYLGAAMGFVVLVPEVRSFGEDIPKEEHMKMAQLAWEKQTPLLGTFVKDAMVMEDFLESSAFSLQPGLEQILVSKPKIIAGVSLGGQIALNTGALDTRFDVVSTNGAFYGYEILFSNLHCYCQWVPKLLDQANIFDLGFLVYPRTLHVGMGAKEKYYNDYSKSAIKRLSGFSDWENLYIEIGPDSGHELIGYGKKIYDIVIQKK